jgi:hypothetical protein
MLIDDHKYLEGFRVAGLEPRQQGGLVAGDVTDG